MFIQYIGSRNVCHESTNKYMTTDFLSSVRLRRKVGSVVMLLRNLDVSSGMCNGTRFIVKELIICYDDKNLPFRVKSTQFPVKLAFSISINKAQGQSFGRVELHLPEDVFFCSLTDIRCCFPRWIKE
uniref:ATP-dependent DNA helicase n=1 Tax=Caenorhabditis japonica TaxID=281687 RepID=A0A8R1I636_CAEJA